MSVEGEAEWDVCVCARGLVACEWWRVQVRECASMGCSGCVVLWVYFAGLCLS